MLFSDLAWALAYLLITCLAAVIIGMWVYIRRKRCFEMVSHFCTAESRRAAHPPQPGHHPNVLEDQAFQNCARESGFFEGLWWQAIIPQNPNALVVIVHGYGDHSDFIMLNHANEIVRETNSVVVLFDQHGFGRSEGLWAFIPNWFIHVGSCRRMVEFAKTKFSGLKTFGLGYSMGGGVLTTIEALQPILDGMILLAPMLIIREEMKPPPLVRSMLTMMAKFFPTWPVAVSSHNGQLSYRDAAFRAKEHELNKLQYPGFPRLGTAVSMLTAQQWLEENCYRVNCPFLVMHGTADVVTAIEGSRRLMALTAPDLDKKMVTMEGYRHHILGPSQDAHFNEKPYKIICEWITSQTQSS